MSKSEVLVLGGGLAGMMAAIWSAEQGKQVTLLAQGTGTLPVSSGVIDIFGFDDDGNAVYNPFRGVAMVPDYHPYKKTGIPAVQDGINAFKRIMKEYGMPYVGAMDEHQWVVLPDGSMKPTGLCSESMSAGGLFTAKSIGILAIPQLIGHNPDKILAGLRQCFTEEKEYFTIEYDLKIDSKRLLSLVDIAQWMDKAENCSAFINDIKSKLQTMEKRPEILLLPPVLGMASDAVYQRLKDTLAELGVKPIEIIGGNPSVGGIRLQRVLWWYIRKLNIDYVEGCEITEGIIKDGKALGVKAGLKRQRSYYGDKIIYALGAVEKSKHFADNTATGSVEGIFKLPIAGPKEHSLDELKGIRVNSSLNPIGADDKVIFDNVYVIGNSLSGFDGEYECSGNGVALASAHKAIKQ